MQKKKNKSDNLRLSKYEQAIEDSLNFKNPRAPNSDDQRHFKGVAKRTLKELKDARTNIRLDTGDMMAIRELAKGAGLPYQTFIAHILHLYITGQLLNLGEVKKIIASGVFGSRKFSPE